MGGERMDGDYGKNEDTFSDFCRTLFEGHMAQLPSMLDDAEESVPPGIYAKIKELEGPAIEALRAVVSENTHQLKQEVFHLLDSNNDCKLHKEELLSLGGLLSPEISADDKLKYLFSLMDTKRRGFCDGADVEDLVSRSLIVLVEEL